MGYITKLQPVRGGIAFGFDRPALLLAAEESIREVIPFPKTTSALDLMTGTSYFAKRLKSIFPAMK